MKDPRFLSVTASKEFSAEEREREAARVFDEDRPGWWSIGAVCHCLHGDVWCWAAYGQFCRATMDRLMRNIAVAGALQVAFEAGAQYEVQLQCREIPEWHPSDRRPCPWVVP